MITGKQWTKSFWQNTFKHLSNKICVPNKIEDSNIHAFNMMIWKTDQKF